MRLRLAVVFCALVLVALVAAVASNPPWATEEWLQWGQNSRHTGFVNVVGQSPSRELAHIRYDPFVPQEQLDEFGSLTVHYQVPLVDGHGVFMEFKTGTWVPCNPPSAWLKGAPCGPNTWDQEIWNEKRLVWHDTKLVEKWSFQSDWKPEPNGHPNGLFGWEPVFHPALTGQFIYVPGFGGTVWKVSQADGTTISHINPFGDTIDANTFVSSPLTADAHGNIYFNVLKLAPADPWVGNDVVGAWLVKVAPDDSAAVVTYATLVPNAPPPDSTKCPGMFFEEKTLPWPPSRKSKPMTELCGSQRPAVNIAPAVAADGTIYTISRSHFDALVGYLVAVNPDLTPKWQATLQKRLHDGCGFLVPIATKHNQPDACREGARLGVDHTTNDWGSGWIDDKTTSTPTILPDGNILIGVITNYNGGAGHTMKFNPQGHFLGAYEFGFDVTPGVFSHDNTYSIALKDNHGGVALYCFYPDNPVCKPLPPGPFDITQLSADLKPEWKFKSTNTDKHHPNGFEWCINAPAYDKNGTVYANSEDGNLYVLNQDGTLRGNIFLKKAIGAAYTPLSLGPDGKIYTQNDGVMFVVGQ